MFRKQKRPSYNKIEAMFRSQLAPEFKQLERQRAAIRRNTCLIVGWFLAFLAYLRFLTYPATSLKSTTEQKLEWSLWGVFMVGFLIVGFWTYIKIRVFRSDFKERVMKPIAKRFFPELSYDPEAFVRKGFYDECDLFRKQLDNYSGNDLFRGKVGEVDFEFSELLCQYTSGVGKRRITHTAFRGFFFVGDFHRDLHFRTKIEPDLAENLFGVAGRGIQRFFSSDRRKLVDLENLEFERVFKVTAADQVEARFILTPKFMERLLDFFKKAGDRVHLSFCNGRMFLAISTNHDYFEPSYFGEILSRKDLMKFIDMLLLLFRVADELCHQPRVATAPNPPKMPPLPNLHKFFKQGLH